MARNTGLLRNLVNGPTGVAGAGVGAVLATVSAECCSVAGVSAACSAEGLVSSTNTGFSVVFSTGSVADAGVSLLTDVSLAWSLPACCSGSDACCSDDALFSAVVAGAP